MDRAEAQRLTDRLHLLDIARDGPQRLVRRLVGGAAAELVVGDDAVALVGHPQHRLAQIVAGQARPAIQQEQDLVASPVAVGDDLMAINSDPPRFDLINRYQVRFPHWPFCIKARVAFTHF